MKGDRDLPSPHKWSSSRTSWWIANDFLTTELPSGLPNPDQADQQLFCAPVLTVLFFVFLSSWQADQDSSFPWLHSSPLAVTVSRPLYHLKGGVRLLPTTVYLSWSIVSKSTSREITLGGGGLYQQAWIVSVNFVETSISFQSTEKLWWIKN